VGPRYSQEAVGVLDEERAQAGFHDLLLQWRGLVFGYGHSVGVEVRLDAVDGGKGKGQLHHPLNAVCVLI